MDPDAVVADIVRGAAIVAEKLSIPFRQPKWQEPTFDSQPLLVTRTRPVPNDGVWYDFLTLSQPDPPEWPKNYGARLQRWVATGLTNMATSGLEYRWVRNGALMPVQDFNAEGTLELAVDRFAALPWPANWRQIDMILLDTDSLVIQVRNAGGGVLLALAGIQGFYFPDLGSQGRARMESGGIKGNTDASRT